MSDVTWTPRAIANPLWVDDDFARSAGYRGRLLPPILVGWTPFSLKEPEDGKGSAVDVRRQLPVPLTYTNVRNAGSETEWLKPVHLGEPLSCQSHIVDITAREGKMGVGIYITQMEEVTGRRRRAGVHPAPHRGAVPGTEGRGLTLRIIDLGALAGAYATRLLAESGHDVIRVDPVDGDAVRRTGPFLGDAPDPEQGAFHHFLNAGKRKPFPRPGVSRGIAGLPQVDGGAPTPW